MLGRGAGGGGGGVGGGGKYHLSVKKTREKYLVFINLCKDGSIKSRHLAHLAERSVFRPVTIRRLCLVKSNYVFVESRAVSLLFLSAPHPLINISLGR